MIGCVYIRRHDVAQNAGIFGMQNDRAVQNVQRQMNVTRVGKVSRHSFKHSGDQTDPHELVQYIQSKKFLEHKTCSGNLPQKNLALECLSVRGI